MYAKLYMQRVAVVPENEDHTAEVPAVIERDLVRNLAQYSDRASVDWQAANKWWPAKTNYETWQKLAKRSLFKTFKKKVQDIQEKLEVDLYENSDKTFLKKCNTKPDARVAKKQNKQRLRKVTIKKKKK